jgi:transposase
VEFHPVGIDVSKDKLNAAILLAPQKARTKVVANDVAGFEALLQWVQHQVKDKLPAHFVMEATGHYHLPLALFLNDRGCHISVVNPAQVKRFGESLAARTKNDQKDCLIIARFAALMRPALWNPPPLEYRQLQHLLQRLDQLDKMLRQEKNRCETLSVEGCPQEVINSVRNLIDYLESERKRLLEEIRGFVEKHQTLKEDVAILTSIPGIGELTALRLAIPLEGGKRFRTARQFAAYLGLTPKERQSGTSLRGRTRLSKMGPRGLRKALYMPAIVAKSLNPDVRALFDGLVERGKSKMAALGAAMRKLSHIAFGVMRNRTTYRPMDAQR